MDIREISIIRKICILTLVIGFVSALTPGSAILLSPEQDRATEDVSISICTENEGIRIDYQIHDFILEKVPIKGRDYFRILLGKESNILDKGKPDLPNICRSVIIPDDAKMSVEVIHAGFEEHQDIFIVPSKGPHSRNVYPDMVPVVFDKIYRRDAWYPEVLVDLGDPYIVRDFRGQVVRVNPFQYNPVTKTLRVYTDITMEVSPVGPGEVNVYQRMKPLDGLNPSFYPIYEDHFLNFDGAGGPYQPIDERGNMLVITNDSFWDAMLPFVAWKNSRGIPTEMVKVSEIGCSSTAIKNYIRDYFHADGLTFVLLVGDIDQVPTIEVYIYYGWSASDPSYSYILGDDHYPDLLVGRFSAQTIEEVETQVERTINHETMFPSFGGWYYKGIGIASDDGDMYGDPMGDDGEFDWEHLRNIRADLLGHTYTVVDELYEGDQGGEDLPGDPTSEMITDSINGGRGIINYCGHGSYDSWTTTGFDTVDIDALTNTGKLPFIWAVACLNGMFDNFDSCFAETWLRATHNGEPAGAVAVFMASNNQFWKEPMDAQDEMVDLLVNGEGYTFGGLSFNGCMHMNDEYGESGFDMTDTWHVFGDPSLQLQEELPPVHNEEKGTYYDTIQAAINDADPGNTLRVSTGIYDENLVIDTQITLIGRYKAATIINGINPGDVVNISADRVTVTGFTIQHADSMASGIFAFEVDNINISGNIITQNFWGIRIDSSCNSIIEDNIIIGNGAQGIQTTSSSCTITGNVIRENTDGIWIRIPSSPQTTIIDNTITMNHCSGLNVCASQLSYPTYVNDNNISENEEDGIILWQSKGVTISSNTITNQISGNGIFLEDIGGPLSSDNIIIQNIISNNAIGINIDAAVDNSMYHNDFLENGLHAFDEHINIWDNGALSGGNYWDDYEGSDRGDGIGDSPYEISPYVGSKDMYPLITRFGHPIADFSYTPVFPTPADFVTFADESQDRVGPITDWTWNFGDGNVSRNGIGLSFNGSGADVTTPARPDSSVQTIEAWVKANRTHYGINCKAEFLSQWGGGGIGSSAWNLEFNEDNLIYSVYDGDSSTTLAAPYSDTTNWHHIAAVHNEGFISIYIDGQLAAGPQSSVVPQASTRYDITMGRGFAMGGRSRYYDGLMDEVRIYTRPLSAHEIQDNFNGSITQNGLEHWWRLSERSGMIAHDCKHGADGTLNGAGWIQYGDSSPGHQYSNTGIYDVTLSVRDQDGGFDSETKPLTILTLSDHVYVDIDAPPGGDGSLAHPFQRIQEGIDHTAVGGIVSVFEGTYVENIDIYRTLTLHGDDKYNTIIDGDGIGNVINISADEVSLSEFTIQNSGTYDWLHPERFRWWFAGISLQSDNNTIYDNIIKNNYNGVMTYCDESSNNMIYWNTINDNANIGLYLLHASHNLIKENHIRYNNSYHNIMLQDSSYNNITWNYIEGSITGFGLWFDHSSYNNLTNNEIAYNQLGVWLEQASNNNLIYHNNFIQNGGVKQVHDRCENFWDFEGEGNYWSDHECVGNPSGGSQPYEFDDGVDQYPFENRWGWFYY